MEESEVCDEESFVAHQQFPKQIQPSERSLHDSKRIQDLGMGNC